ncbi:MAG TPA: pitrilysin family protein, partial [Pyrinomonadaceae bacterium]|nr:pitrilysin family protein [Pyrinomonadaceae bacterium]
MRTGKRHITATLLALALLMVAPLGVAAQTRRDAASSTNARTTPAGQQSSSAQQQPSGIPTHPRELKFTPLDYTPPKRDRFRHVLSNGAVAYLVEDHDLPLVNVSTIIRTGAYLVPPGKEGLAALTGSQIRAGGAGDKTAEQFDEAADFLAANLSSSIGETQGNAVLNCLSKDIDTGLGLYFDMLKSPRFQQDRLALGKSQILQNMERRNDDTGSIEAREWGRLMRGTNHFTTKFSTKASIESITRDDLVAFHKQYYHPASFIFAISGDFNTQEMIARLERMMQGWPGAKANVPPVPKPEFKPVAGVYT